MELNLNLSTNIKQRGLRAENANNDVVQQYREKKH